MSKKKTGKWHVAAATKNCKGEGWKECECEVPLEACVWHRLTMLC